MAHIEITHLTNRLGQNDAWLLTHVSFTETRSDLATFTDGGLQRRLAMDTLATALDIKCCDEVQFNMSKDAMAKLLVRCGNKSVRDALQEAIDAPLEGCVVSA